MGIVGQEGGGDGGVAEIRHVEKREKVGGGGMVNRMK